MAHLTLTNEQLQAALFALHAWCEGDPEQSRADVHKTYDAILNTEDHQYVR